MAAIGQDPLDYFNRFEANPFVISDTNVLFAYANNQTIRSTDGGAYWKEITPSVNGELRAVPNSTILLFYNRVRPMLSESLDSGKTWSVLNDSFDIVNPKLYTAFRFWSPRDMQYFGRTLDSLLVTASTHDSGQHFSIITIDSVLTNFLEETGLKKAWNLPEMMWLDSLHGCFWSMTQGADNYSKVIITTDAGRSWHRPDFPSLHSIRNMGKGSCYNGIYVLQPNVSGMRSFSYSTDYGLTWVTLPDKSSPAYLRNIMPLSSSSFLATGWPEALGNDYFTSPVTAFWYSTNAGMSWVSDSLTARNFDMFGYPLTIGDSVHIYARGSSTNSAKFPENGEYLFRLGLQKLGIENKGTSENAMMLFPNPCSDHLSVSPAAKKITIYDANGKRVLTVSNPSTLLDLHSISPGTYFLEGVLQNNEIIRKSIVKY
ncbi:MAG TPA: T9SS type A sorting domain-containing protein [Candidatus Kapabacteria bacterium]|nr:T9SS type A sorting domain-containing protein [Candidatus Kapabacteria bacterium]